MRTHATRDRPAQAPDRRQSLRRRQAASLAQGAAHQASDPFYRLQDKPYPLDKAAYRRRNVIERMFGRLKDFRRIATRYDKRADVFLSTILLAAAITWWIN